MLKQGKKKIHSFGGNFYIAARPVSELKTKIFAESKKMGWKRLCKAPNPFLTSLQSRRTYCGWGGALGGGGGGVPMRP
jgi:hypothetical protein